MDINKSISISISISTSTSIPNHIASEIQVPHCFYTAGNDTFWGEKDTVQPFTAMTPLA
jgi:hypothetical protein